MWAEKIGENEFYVKNRGSWGMSQYPPISPTTALEEGGGGELHAGGGVGGAKRPREGRSKDCLVFKGTGLAHWCL